MSAKIHLAPPVEGQGREPTEAELSSLATLLNDCGGSQAIRECLEQYGFTKAIAGTAEGEGEDVQSSAGPGGVAMAATAAEGDTVHYNLLTLGVPDVSKLIEGDLASPIPEDLLDRMVDVSFDVRELATLVGMDLVLSKTAMMLFKAYDYLTALNCDEATFRRYVLAVGASYDGNNKYHNQLHATDVLVTSNALMVSSKLDGRIESGMEKACFLLASIVHDVGHPGRTNPYMINSCSDLAVRYNDDSVLENFHSATAFSLMKLPECDVIANTENKVQARKWMIQLVLATDLAKGGQIMNEFKNLVEESKISDADADHRLLMLKMMIKAADVSNPAKPMGIYKYWTNAIMDEFYLQGDVERRTCSCISMFCDREKPTLAGCQWGFISFVVAPIYKNICGYFSGIEAFEQNLNSNLEFWNMIKRD